MTFALIFQRSCAATKKAENQLSPGEISVS
jgi:hypothetical protein